MVEVFCFDVDGVCCKGKLYDKSGLSIGKAFFDLDWTALKRFKVAGVVVEAITGDNWNADILYNRGISYILSRGKKKEDFLDDICKRHNTTPDKIAYIGDDLFDIGLLNKVGYPFAPFDATRDLFDLTSAYRLESGGGTQVIEELFYYLRDRQLIKHIPFEEEFDKILELDAQQRF